MKKRIVSLAVSAAFVLAVFSGCAAMRRDRIWGNTANDTTTDANYLARSTDDNRMYDPSVIDMPDNAVIPRRPLTVDHLTSFIGMHQNDLSDAFGDSFRTRGTDTGAGRIYNHLLYGNPADIDVGFDNGDRIETISVIATRAQAERWQRELNSRYGTQIAGKSNTGEWLAGGARITMMPYGDSVKIVFSNTI